jgi:hypothetical protein
MLMLLCKAPPPVNSRTRVLFFLKIEFSSALCFLGKRLSSSSVNQQRLSTKNARHRQYTLLRP